jgi:ABC-2 type transport system ATP-binding protein
MTCSSGIADRSPHAVARRVVCEARATTARIPHSAVVGVDRLRVERGGRRAVDDVSLGVPAGAVTGLLGPSGSGKTTLLRAIVGVQIVQGGSVTVLGRPAGTPELRSRVAYVTQAPSLYADLTIRENLAYFARLAAAPADRVGTVIERVALREQAGQVVRTLSGGERSRASLAAALLGDPELLVLDEPTVGLDPVLRRDLWRMFHDLAGEGRSLLVSTHVMDEAERCDELILMRAGRVIAAGRPGSLRRRAGAATLEEAFISLAAAA